jgi:two-component system OmpR family sensor kinase
LASTLVLFSLASWIFYTSTKHHLLDTQREMLKYEAQKIKSTLRILHQSNDTFLYYPTSPNIVSAIYDKDKQYIFGSMQPQHTLFYREADRLYIQSDIEPYYLGAAYLVVNKQIDYTAIENLQKSILFFMLVAGIFFTVLGYFLGKLFVAPMKQSLEKMNHFIQDTTHELNTPISTILTNIEMIETFGKHEENSSELKRIEIASKTLSRIYDDLTYLNLNHQYHRQIVSVNFSELIEERMVYFSAMVQAKSLKIILDIEKNIIKQMDKNDAFRLIDNLISNAIKYNKHQGFLEIFLDNHLFIIKDTGIGIKANELGQILQRFRRANASEGGFGIGLHIVSQVCQNYDFKLEIDSVENEGTEVSVQWEK